MHTWRARSVSLFVVMAAVGGVGVLTSGTARSQLGVAKDYVALQSSSPGTAQSGHANVSGTMTASGFVGGGSGLTGLNASSISSGTLDVARLPIPLVISALQPGSLVKITNTSDLSGNNAIEGVGTGGTTGVRGRVTGASSVNYGVYGETASTSGFGVYGTSTATTGLHYGVAGVVTSPLAYGVFGQANGAGFGVVGQTMTGRGVFGAATNSSGVTFGVYGSTASSAGFGVFGTSSNGIGVGGSSSSTHGVQGTASTASGAGVFGNHSGTTGTAAAVLGETLSNAGRGVFGRALFSGAGVSPFPTGVRGEALATNGIGVSGVASSASGTTYGGLFSSASTGGRGVQGVASAATGITYGVEGISASTGGIGVFGSATALTGGNVGVWGQSSSSSGAGITGLSTSTSGTAYGGYFEAAGTASIAIGALNTGTTGTASAIVAQSNSSGGRAIYGFAPSISGTTYGVLGQSQSGSATAYGVFATGRLGASGAKAFRIDHPFDPENKYLFHYASESPEPQNFYNGLVTTDKNGYAWVELPEWFSEINRDFRYQLTVVDDESTDADEFVMAKVRQRIKGNRFQIRTSAPNVTVSWEVKAIRNDAWMRKYGAPVEADKDPGERGRYQHPELYGKGQEYSINQTALGTAKPTVRRP